MLITFRATNWTFYINTLNIACTGLVFFNIVSSRVLNISYVLLFIVFNGCYYVKNKEFTLRVVDRWLDLCLKHCYYEAIKSFWLLFFSLCADCKQQKRSNIWEGKTRGRDSNCSTRPAQTSLPTRVRVFTCTSACNHQAPKWIIATIITNLKPPSPNCVGALSHNAIKDNRCWESLEGTEIKDYFTLLRTLRAKQSLCSPLSSSNGGGGQQGRSFSLFLCLGGLFENRLLDREWTLFNLGEWYVLEIPGHSVST